MSDSGKSLVLTDSCFPKWKSHLSPRRLLLIHAAVHVCPLDTAPEEVQKGGHQWSRGGCSWSQLSLWENRERNHSPGLTPSSRASTPQAQNTVNKRGEASQRPRTESKGHSTC